jgi:hypothetical protein
MERKSLYIENTQATPRREQAAILSLPTKQAMTKQFWDDERQKYDL